MDNLPIIADMAFAPHLSGLDPDSDGWVTKTNLINRYDLTQDKLEELAADSLIRESNLNGLKVREDYLLIDSLHDHLKQTRPPEIAFAPVIDSALPSVRAVGLRPAGGPLVRIYLDATTARHRADRRYGNPKAIPVFTGSMHRMGYVFYVYKGVYLTRSVSPQFLDV